MAKEDKKQQKKGSRVPASSDPRFAAVYSDPRFRAPKKKDLQVQIDERFSKEDLTSKKSKAKVDRYGRKIKENEDSTKFFDKHYSKEQEKSDDDEEESSEKSQESEEDGSEASDEEIEENDEEDDDDDEEEDAEELEAIKAYERARGIGSGDDSSEESSSEDESEDEEISEEESDDDIAEEKPEEGDPTSKFAVVNMDWDHVTSVDLLATFQSFVPKGGKIISVSVFPSEFGKERMQREEIEGPPRELFTSKKKKEESSDEEEEEEGEIDIEKATRELFEEDNGEDYNSKALRKYQLQRLRYYYAVVICDSISTAKNIYDNCDGTEYESTSNLFDLRYIPEDMDFEDEPRDSASKVPANYKPALFTTDALQHSKVKLTWDETPAERVQMATKAFSQKEIEDMDFKAYLASDSDDSDVEEEMKNKYKSLLGGTNFGDKDALEEAEDDEGDIDMEITFTPALSEGSKKNGDSEKNGDDEDVNNAMENYRQKEKERRKKRKEKIKELKREQEEASRAERRSFKEENKKSKKSEGKKSSRATGGADEDEEEEYFSMKDMMKAEKKNNKKKGKKGTSGADEPSPENKLELDERFSEMYDNHKFAIDPTNTEYKKTRAMDNLLKETSKRSKKKRSAESQADQPASKAAKLSSLVNKIKHRK